MEIKHEPMEFDESIVILKEPKAAPNIFHEYTTKDHKQTIVFDNGSNWARVGFANRKTPQLIFRNLVAKPRKDRNKKEAKEEVQNIQPVTQIGNEILNIEAMRFQLRTQFDRNVVTHFYLQVGSTFICVSYFAMNRPIQSLAVNFEPSSHNFLNSFLNFQRKQQ